MIPEVSATTAMELLPLEEAKPAILKKRRSCELVKTPSPCVKKALFHLGRLKELLRYALENPIVDIEQSDKNVQYYDKHPKGWKQLRFEIPHHPQPGSIVLKEESQILENSGDLLAITGIGGQVKDIVERGDAERSVHISRLEKKNQLSPHEVFTQVRELILRLEEDRRHTEIALDIENMRFASLDQRIDRMCQKRLIQLPIAVQREHDTCATDISELQWHVGYMERQLRRSNQRVEAAEVLNTQLKEQIAFVKQHCPLIEGKLDLEKKSMEDVRGLQKKTDKELRDAKIELQKAEQKYQEVTEKTEREREEMEGKLKGIRGQLKLLKRDLQHSEAMHTAYIKKAGQSRDKMADQEAKLIRLQARAEEAKEEEQEEIYKIEDLRQQIKQVEFETGEINKQKAATETEIESMQEEMNAKIKALESEYQTGLRNLRNLQEENRDMHLDIEDMTEEIKACDKTVAKCDKEIERYLKERERSDGQLKEASAELQNATVVNNELKMQLQKEENRAQAMEDTMKVQAESLRKRVMEEMRQRTALEAKKQSNSHSYLKGKTENKKKRSKVTRTLKETEETVSKIQDDVIRLREEHETTSMVVEKLETRLAVRKAENEKQERQLVAERDVLIPEERVLLTRQMSLKEKIKEMEFDEAQMKQKLKDMLVSKNAMEKRVGSTEANIANLMEDLKEVNFRYTAGKGTNDELQRQLDEATKRLAGWKTDHVNMLETRSKVKDKLEENINVELIRNKELAQQYRDLQSEHIDLKNRLISLYDNKVKLEESVKDHKQLLALQEKFNISLKQYYYDRGEFNKAGLQKFQSEAEGNSDAMVRVQGGLQITLANISKFLRNQVDGVAANEVQETARKVLAAD